jgi:hypothetical protein
MKANWKNPITVRTSFETRIENSLTASEQRRLLRGRPRRSQSCTLTGTGRVATLSARQLFMRKSVAGFLCPLYSDQMVLTSAASASATTLQIDSSAYRRISANSRAIVMRQEQGNVTDFEVVAVSGVGATSLTIDSPGLASGYPAGSLVFPVFESQIVDSYSNGFILTTDKADFQNFTAQERVGNAQLLGIEAVGGNPSGFDTFNSQPVFDGPIDYGQIRYGLNRIGSFSDVGIGQVPVFYGDRAVQSFSALLNCTTRQEAWDFLRFFESRGGRAYSFFFRSPLEDYLVVGTNGNNLIVEDTGELLDWAYRPYLVMELSDGSFDYRQISTVTQNGSNHEIAFVGGASLGSIVGARQLLQVRMFRDEIAERWISTEVCQMTLEVVEVLEEKSITVGIDDTLVDEEGNAIVDEKNNFISTGTTVAIAEDATTAVTPDLELGGCEDPEDLSPAPETCPYSSTEEGPQRLGMRFSIPVGTYRVGSEDRTLGLSEWNTYAAGDSFDSPSVALGDLGFYYPRSGNCNWQARWDEVFSGTQDNFYAPNDTNGDGVFEGEIILPTRSFSTSVYVRIYHNGSGAWILRVLLGLQSDVDPSDLEASGTQWIKETGASPVGTYVPDESFTQYLAAGTITVVDLTP